jgi:hypothetical protein
MNIDKGNQSSSGEDMIAVGHIECDNNGLYTYPARK